jgi:hypothetical protein
MGWPAEWKPRRIAGPSNAKGRTIAFWTGVDLM